MISEKLSMFSLIFDVFPVGFGSNDGTRVWVNNEPVFSKHIPHRLNLRGVLLISVYHSARDSVLKCDLRMNYGKVSRN